MLCAKGPDPGLFMPRVGDPDQARAPHALAGNVPTVRSGLAIREALMNVRSHSSWRRNPFACSRQDCSTVSFLVEDSAAFTMVTVFIFEVSATRGIFAGEVFVPPLGVSILLDAHIYCH